jgi:hypothetical protein
MRESIGGALMLRIFLVVIVIFVVFLCVSANFARAFRVKNGVITIIEQYEGINDKSIPLVEEYISRMGYSCYDPTNYDNITNYVLMIDSSHPNGVSDDAVDVEGRIYNVQVCTDWNFPIIDAFGTWRFMGKTELIKKAVELR